MERILLVHEISLRDIKVDQGKVEVAGKMLPPINMNMIIYFLGNVIFNKHFTKDVSKFSKLKDNLLVKENYLIFDR